MTTLAALRSRFACPLVLVTGGKGGVGKTTLAANLAVALAGQPLRTLLVDLDLGLGDLDVMLQLEPHANLEDALRAGRALEECVTPGPGGVSVLPASNGSAPMARLSSEERARLLEGIARLSGNFDLIVGDSAAGIGADVLAFAACADVVLVVTTPDPAAVTDAYGLIKALEFAAREHALAVPTPELVLNQTSGLDEAEATAAKLAEICQRFLARSPRLAGWLPRSPRVADAARRRRPFALARTGAAALELDCLERLARRVLRTTGVACAARDGAARAAQALSQHAR
jgi:flagellar biosynthesis protein FlhG